MGIRGEVFSTKVILQNRTYFFNVKENRLGDLYLNIVESKNKETGGFDRQSVILFADDLQEFLQGFDESLRVMEKEIRTKRKEIRPARAASPRAGEGDSSPAARGTGERGRPKTYNRKAPGGSSFEGPQREDRKSSPRVRGSSFERSGPQRERSGSSFERSGRPRSEGSARRESQPRAGSTPRTGGYSKAGSPPRAGSSPGTGRASKTGGYSKAGGSFFDGGRQDKRPQGAKRMIVKAHKKKEDDN
jgi:hypothetical protein